MEKKTKSITIRVESDEKQAIKELAEIENRTMSNYLTTVIKNHLKALRKSHLGDQDDA